MFPYQPPNIPDVSWFLHNSWFDKSL